MKNLINRSDLEQEIWLPIVGYEVSNLGRVKSLNYHRTGTERLMKPYKRHGYLYVALRIDGKTKNHRIHRLVAQAFLPNPHNLPEVNHINEDKTDNRAKNLEWCDRRYNNNYGTRTEKTCKPVLQYTLDGILVREWPSTREAGRNGFKFQNISACCKGILKTYKGYIWKFKEAV